MQSDERVTAAIAALKPQISVYLLNVESALERARKLLAAESNDSAAAESLGEFAQGRIDAARFAMLAEDPGPLDAIAFGVLERTIERLEAISGAGDEQFIVALDAGGSIGEAVHARFETLGAAYSAATLVDLARRRAPNLLGQGLSLESHPFEKWTAADRRIAPPLVVCVEGPDVDALGIARFVDASVRLALIVTGQTAPAPLVRLISPGVFVSQSSDITPLSKSSDYEGPAVVAVMEDGGARFTHDPRRGRAVWQRLDVTRMPDVQARKSVGRRSAWQQREDVAHLKALAEQPVLPPNSADALVAAIGGGAADPAERLTSWLLDQSSPPS